MNSMYKYIVTVCNLQTFMYYSVITLQILRPTVCQVCTLLFGLNINDMEFPRILPRFITNDTSGILEYWINPGV